MSPKVLLIGLPGTGKSSVGRRVAERLGTQFADSDSMIEIRAGRTIPRIFAEGGEPAFRKLEASVVADALKRQALSSSQFGRQGLTAQRG